MPRYYLPQGDSLLSLWVTNFLAYANAHAEDVGLTLPDLAPLGTSAADYTAALDAHVAAVASAEAQRSVKEEAKRRVVVLVRLLVRQIQAHPGTTDERRAGLGITVPAPRVPTSPPLTRPVAMVDVSQRLRHRIRFADESTPTLRAKPDGVTACEIWRKVGAPAPADASELVFAGSGTRSPVDLSYDGADAGKVVYYWLRWVDTRHRPGPWSAAVSATVVG